MQLASLVRPELVFPHLVAANREEILRTLADRISTALGWGSAQDLYLQLAEREALGSTALGQGVAIPHCKLARLSHPLVALGVAPEGVEFGAADGQPVQVFLVVASPPRSPAEHLQALAAISRWVRVEGRTRQVLDAPDAAALVSLLRSP